MVHTVEKPPEIDRRRKHVIEAIVDRITVRSDARSRIAGSVETALSLGKGVLHIVYPVDGVQEQRWPTEVHSQHFACDRCGRSFEPLTPHSFSFNSPLGWCSECEGLGTQLGANPAMLLRDPKLTLAEGAVALWPNVKRPMFATMLAALAKQTGIRTDVPFDQLTARERRIVMHGTGEEWIMVGEESQDELQKAEGGRRKAELNLAGSLATLGSTIPIPIQRSLSGARRSRPAIGGDARAA